MKKYLFILVLTSSSLLLSDVTYEDAVVETLQHIDSNVSYIQDDTSSISGDVGYIRDDISYLYSDFYNFLYSDTSRGFFSLSDAIYNFINPESEFYQDLTAFYGEIYTMGSYVPDIYSMLQNLYYTTTDIKEKSSEFYDYLTYYSLGSNVEAIKTLLENLDLTNEQILTINQDNSTKFDDIVSVLGNNTTEMGNIGGQLDDILAAIRSDTDTSSTNLPSFLLSSQQLKEYGKDVSIRDLEVFEVSTKGEFNSDVISLLGFLAKSSISQNNSLLSSLTNLQCIADSLDASSNESEAEQKLRDLENDVRHYNSEGDSVISLDWSSYFTPPSFLTTVRESLSINLTDFTFPDKVTLIDTFHYEICGYPLVIDDLSFSTHGIVRDLVDGIRVGFAFVYWTLTFYISWFFVKLWFKLYQYVAGELFGKSS